MRLRLIPILICTAVIALPLKIGSLWWTAGHDSMALAQEKAGAAEVSENAGDGAVAESPTISSADEGAEPEPAQEAAMAAPDEQSETPQEPTPEFQRADLPVDPFELTDKEIEILQSLAQRRELLDKRERELEQRTAVLAAAETRIEEKIAKLEALRAAIEELVIENDQRNEARIQSLSKIYSAMKPKEAARIFESLDMGVVLSVLQQMKERTSAAILAKMDPSRAQAVTLQLAQQHRLPVPKE